MAGQTGQYSPERLRQFALRAKHNHEVMFMFMGLILGLVALMAVFHLTRLLGKRFWPKKCASDRPSFAVRLSRKIRNVSVRKAPALPSIGHAGVIVIYVIINLLLTFVHLSKQPTGIVTVSNLGSRTAWMAIANLTVTICLSIKNTPLSYIAWSYERINILHQVAGGTTFSFVVLHVSFYTSYFVHEGRPSRLLYKEEICGMVAALCFLLLVFSGAVVRNWWYELFYYMHICSWVVGIITLSLHQPEFTKKIIFILITVAGIWVLDRIVRLLKLAVNSTSNEVTLHPLPNGGTRVYVKKSPPGATSGRHCFLWIPKVRGFETHPFTIVAADPLEFVIASYDGFTADLHKLALASPGAFIKGSVNGAYGTFPDALEHDTLLFIAGGSGASFTFGVVLDALRQMRPEEDKTIILVWLVKHHSYFPWFVSHIKNLRSETRVSLRLYVTRQPKALEEPSTTDDGKDTALSTIAAVPTNSEQDSTAPPSPISIHPSADPEKDLSSDGEMSLPSEDRPSHYEQVPITYERPDVSEIIRGVVQDTPVNKRILVMGCGPNELMRTVRNTSASCIRSDGPALEVHCEEFGW